MTTRDPPTATVHFVQPTGERQSVTDTVGRTVMDFAVDNGVAGILSQCGGACICTLCHCYVSCDWLNRVGPISCDEKEMLEFVSERRKGSRLACQVYVSLALDGLTVHVAER